MLAAPGGVDGNGVLDRSRVSDKDLLQTIRDDLSAVYTDVLHIPIPDGIAAVLSRLEAAFQPSHPACG